MTDTLHTCSYYCHVPACIKAQRDELRDKLFAERERCAVLCDEVAERARRDFKAAYKHHDDGRSDGANECSDAIRSEQ
jgi:hypothetical protein